jgi:FAD/FMN-containing dehydrogenase
MSEAPRDREALLNKKAAQFQLVESWGRTRRGRHLCRHCFFADEAIKELSAESDSLVVYGRGRSYGDVCLNDGGRLVLIDGLDRFVQVDWESGKVLAEAGLTFDQLLKVTVPRGWFPPVTPGTKFVTLGGAVANDVHGKNHESAGSFGCHVTRIGLARSPGEVLSLSREENADLFAATVGGLGLTGLILWVEFQLLPIGSAFIDTETLPIADLEAFFALAAQSSDWPYTVAWVDCLAKERDIGRGFFIRGRHADSGGLAIHRDPRLSVPIDAPGGLLNAHTIGLFNALYRHRPWALGRKTMHYDSFFYPLDAVSRWNRLYGSRGFFQHQSVVPMSGARDTTRKLLKLTAEHGEGSFLVVLKLFGDRPSPGILSFPMLGATLALDFPNKGESTQRLLARMTDVVIAAGGRLYPAKDATMSAAAFRTGYPAWCKVEAKRDPAIMSDFWRRVTKDAA